MNEVMWNQWVTLSEAALKNIEWIGISVLVSYALNWILLKSSQKYLSSRSLLPSGLSIKKHFKGSIFWILFSTGLKILSPALNLGPVTQRRVDVFVGIMLVCFVAWGLTHFVDLIKVVLFKRYTISGITSFKERKVRTQLQFIEKLVLIFIYVLSASSILLNFDGARQLGGSLIASAGLAGITLGFAAQRSLSSLLAGFQIAFTQPIRIDDVVVVEGEWGRIEEITLTYVVVRIWDRRTLVVPITYFLEKPFQNWTRASTDLLGVVYLYLDYHVSLDELREEFARFLKSEPLWDGVTQNVKISNLTEKTMEVRFAMSATDAAAAFDLRCLAREHMVKYIREKYPKTFPQIRLSSLDQTKGSIPQGAVAIEQME